MAVREISTRLVLEGEKAYRDGMKEINRELKTLDSQLKLVESDFKGQQNTVAALEAKNKALNDMIGKQTEKFNAEKTALAQMQDHQQKYTQAAEAARQKLKALADETDDATKETQEYKDQVAAIQKEIKKYEAAENSAAEKVDQHTQKMNSAKMGLNNLNGELQKNEKYLDEAKNSTDGCAKSIDGFGKETKEAAAEAEELGKKGKQGVDALAEALAAAGVAATIKQIAQELRECVDASIEFESAMAGVAKTTDLTDEELAAMADGIKELSTRIPLTTTELAQIAEVAGQLGVAKDDLLAFTEVMAALGVATNMTSDEAATMLAQFATVTGMDPAFYSNLGSAIVDLGNSYATNEKKITDMAQTMAGAGTNAKISEANILGLSTAVTSLGIESGTGGTNMAKLIGMMQKAVETGEGLDDWAAAAGMSAQQFAALWGTDATAALTAFIGNLNNLDQSAVVTLDNLGIGEERLTRMITSLANAEQKNGLLTNTLKTANTAWKENSALQKEAATRYNTTESKIQLFKNATNNLRIAIGDQLNPTINAWVKTGTDVAKWAENLVKTNPELVKLITTLVSAGAAFAGVATAIAVVSKAMTGLGAILTANPWALAIAGVAALAAALLMLASDADDADADLLQLGETAKDIAKKVDDATGAFEKDTEKIEAAAGVANQYITRLEELEKQESLTAEEQREYARTLEILQSLIPDLNLEIDEQTGKLKDGAAAVRDQTQAWKDAQLAEARLRYRQELVDGLVEAQHNLGIAEAERAKNDAAIAEAQRKKNEALEKQAELTGKTVDVLKGLQTTMGPDQIHAYRFAIEGLSDEDIQKYNEWGKAGQEADATLATLYANTVALDGAVTDLGGAYDTAKGQLEGYDDAMAPAAEETDKMTEANRQFAEGAAMVQAEMEALNKAYKESYDAAYENITSSMGLFENMSKTTKASMKDMIASLESQIKYMDKYASNLQEAARLGVDEGLLAKLSDGSKESAAYLQAIVDDGGKNVDALNEKLAGVETGKQAFSTTVAEMETNYTEEADKIITKTDEMVSAFEQQGAAYRNSASTMQGAIDGIEDQIPALQANVDRVNAIINRIGIGNGKKSGSDYGPPEPPIPHAAGKEYVPEDGYLAELHKGEMVLTALQAKAYRAMRYADYVALPKMGDSIHNNNTAFGGITIQVYGAGNGEEAGRKAAAEFRRQMRLRGSMVN